MFETSAPVTEVMADLRLSIPWILIPMVTAFAVAWLADDRPGRWPTPPWTVPLIEGLVHGAISAAAVVVVVARALEEAGRAPSSSLPALTMAAGGIGLLLGTIAPSVYRRAVSLAPCAGPAAPSPALRSRVRCRSRKRGRGPART